MYATQPTLKPTTAEARQTLKVETYHKKGNPAWGVATLSYWFSAVDGKHTVLRDLTPGIEGHNTAEQFDTIEEARRQWAVGRRKMARFEYVRVS